MVLARHLPSTFLMSVRPKGIKLAPSAATARVCQVQPMVGKKEKKALNLRTPNKRRILHKNNDKQKRASLGELERNYHCGRNSKQERQISLGFSKHFYSPK
jgi:hypothetical protein